LATKRRPRIKNTLIFIAFVIVVVGFLYAISGERAHRIPEDEMHMVIDRNEVCMGCHGPGKISERKPAHPPKDDCIKCHKTKRNRKKR
jgi:hypothetical protein